MPIQKTALLESSWGCIPTDKASKIPTAPKVAWQFLTMPKAHPEISKPTTDSVEQSVLNQRFVNALNTALVSNRYSQRKLCADIGVTIGTMTKYMRGSINPFKVGTEVQERLAAALGVNLPSLLAYYRTGEYASHITREDVTSWIRSEGAQSDIPFILDATSSVFRSNDESQAVAPEKYTWPAEMLKERNISASMQDRLGLTEDVMYRLSLGEFEPATVEAFAILLNRSPDEVQAAFSSRSAL